MKILPPLFKAQNKVYLIHLIYLITTYSFIGKKKINQSYNYFNSGVHSSHTTFQTSNHLSGKLLRNMSNVQYANHDWLLTAVEDTQEKSVYSFTNSILLMPNCY